MIYSRLFVNKQGIITDNKIRTPISGLRCWGNTFESFKLLKLAGVPAEFPVLPIKAMRLSKYIYRRYTALHELNFVITYKLKRSMQWFVILWAAWVKPSSKASTYLLPPVSIITTVELTKLAFSRARLTWEEKEEKSKQRTEHYSRKLSREQDINFKGEIAFFHKWRGWLLLFYMCVT